MPAWRAAGRGLSEVLGGLLVALMVTGALLVYARAFNAIYRAGGTAVEAVESEALAWSLALERVEGGAALYNPFGEYIVIEYLVVNTTAGPRVVEANITVPPYTAVTITDPSDGEVIAVVTEDGAVIRSRREPGGSAASQALSAAGTWREWLIRGMEASYYTHLLSHMIDVGGVNLTSINASFKVRVEALDSEDMWSHRYKVTMYINGVMVYNGVCVAYPSDPCVVSAGPITVRVTLGSVLGDGYDDVEVNVTTLYPSSYTNGYLIVMLPDNVTTSFNLEYGNTFGEPVDLVVHERSEEWMEPQVILRLYGQIPVYTGPPALTARLVASLLVEYENSYMVYMGNLAVPVLVAEVVEAGGG